MNEYETIYIAEPDLPAGRVEKISEKVLKILKEGKAEIIDQRDWGVRKLAYRIGKFTSGRYIFFNYTGNGHFVAELERTLKYEEGVVRYLTLVAASEKEIARRKKRINQPEEGRLELGERGWSADAGPASENSLNGRGGGYDGPKN
ncbi:MAG: 30S ribosomal protein S6 [Deltaproteobacteria bacterium]|nr:30S ribosomal protein S6 [Deltaproteobacteria bacterium]